MNLKKYFNNVKFDRNEFSGSFGDIGTDFPLIIGMILVCKLDSASVLTMFGLIQIITGFVYGVPMPIQPLKIMAVLMITQKLSGNLLYGAGLSIGIVMLLLNITGLLEWFSRIIPKCVIRGLQLALGISLASIALKDYVQSDSMSGYLLAFAGFALTLFLIGNRKYPPGLFVILLGVIYALIFNFNPSNVISRIGFALPQIHIPLTDDIIKGFLFLAIPQIPLSISNSVISTKRTLDDIFPDNSISMKKIGWTYSIMNIINPFFSGIPTCHGAGGLAGHTVFGARTGGSVVIYGSFYLIVGLFFSNAFNEIIKIFPLPILGVVLLFESLTMMSFIKDAADRKTDLFVALLVTLIAVNLPNGYLISLIIGTVMVYLIEKKLIIKSI